MIAVLHVSLSGIRKHFLLFSGFTTRAIWCILCTLFLMYPLFSQRCVHISDVECGGVPAQCSTRCGVCGSGHAPGEERTRCLCGLGKYGHTWDCWCSPCTSAPWQTRMWFSTRSLNQCFGPWTTSRAGSARWVICVKALSALWPVTGVHRFSSVCFLQVFVCLVVILTGSILAIAYLILLPMIFRTYTPLWIAWHVCYGHWNMVMIIFHYYKAITTSPGSPPTVRFTSTQPQKA